MKKAEKIIMILSFIAIGLNFLLVPGGGILTVLTLLILTIIYGFLGFAFFNDIRLRGILKKSSYVDVSGLRILGAVGAGWALSATINGLMFKIQSWPGADLNLITGIVSLSILMVVGLLKYSKNKSFYYTRIFRRVAIFGGLALILILIPQKNWIQFKYRNHPAYVNAVIESMADPDNRVLWEKAEIERQKIYEDRQSEE